MSTSLLSNKVTKCRRSRPILCLYVMKYFFQFRESAKIVVTAVAIIVISTFAFASELEYVNVSRKEIGNFYVVPCYKFNTYSKL